MNNWEQKKLEDIIDFNPSELLSKGSFAKKIAMEKIKPFTRNIDEYEISEYKGGTKFKNGDTLIARITPCLENGKTAKVDILEDEEIGFGSTEFIVARAKFGISDEDYVYYLMIEPNTREIAIKSMVGSSGRQRVQLDVVKNYEVVVPTLEEQIEIGKTLKVLDDKIKLNERINHHLLLQAIAIHKNYCIDGIDDSFGVESVKSLSKEVVTGKTPSTKRKDFYGDSLPFITIPDMHGMVYCVETVRYLSSEGEASQHRKTLPVNSIAVSCIATPGLVSLFDRPSQTNQQINSVVAKGNQEYYLYLELLSKSQLIIDLGSSGSATYNLNKTQFEKIEILAPSIEKREYVNELVSPLFKTMKLNLHENVRLKEIKDSLLPKLMNGEISLN